MIFFSINGEEIQKHQQLLTLISKRSAEERLAYFLMNLSKRYQRRGLSGDLCVMPMFRFDIVNYID